MSPVPIPVFVVVGVPEHHDLVRLLPPDPQPHYRDADENAEQKRDDHGVHIRGGLNAPHASRASLSALC